MADDTEALQNFQPEHEFFVGVDSDGCVFDSMEIKHKECFAPQFIKHFRLQPVSKYAREVWEFVNLYSKSRGVNRFPALSNALNLLAERPEVQARGVTPPSTDALDAWIAKERKLTNATLEEEIRRGNEALAPILKWSKAVNAAIADMVYGIPPFPCVQESLERMQPAADLMVVSQTPTEALEREWREHNLTGYVRLIAGQELGSKADHLRLAAAGKYGPGRALMIGDAPGDFRAAKFNHLLFYPILPGAEEASWERFYGEALDRFFNGQYAGAYEAELIEEFNRRLPETPPWKR
ncbi:MAG: HAD family hydrolase [Verrucomicrobia bacterium]|nr:HAD family hydrolase [Verrucomicrobiota bacterium]